MKWSIVFKKFFEAAIGGALTSLAASAQNGEVTAKEAAASAVAGALLGLANATRNYMKHKDAPQTV